ncbi:MucB/RseB C-terminal domain-containing protein [Glaciimonas sp. PCH181]|uniref:MucB/RseB C-terminal domain-containing protein n=1 Tax=Glaciimonas sp. PCH181 TaxID=2133943 RepID=UPI000D370DE2|nr:MucB/RseB C-terminal domain-containing protein [Glaciimonas sp. PCH181]PUA20083.1 transcriptional regulator [Glaciimonas sp. PCH181]
MRQTKVLLRVAVIFSTLLALSAQAEGGATEKLYDNHEAQTLLKRIQAAAQKLNYSGTFVYQQANQMRTSRITHMLEGRNEIEKLEVLDGKPREYIRHNEDVTCYIPETKTLLVEKRVTQDVFPAILASIPSDLTDYYNVKLGEVGRVAGQDCQAVLLEPKDKMRYGYKLWAEKNSGLLLRAQTLNSKNEIVEQISFTQIAIGNIARSRVKSSFGNTSGWHVEHTAMSPANLNDWVVTGMPPGFKKVRELKRVVIDNPPAQNTTGSTPVRREVSQIVFSDGLAAISVFIEPGSQSRTEGSMQQGALNIVGKRQGDFWLTIVGEVPAVAIRQVANSIELKNK